ncbi:MAG TPA: hypothetical protein VIV11_11750 [Kofleriaceae bacterium]
MRSAALALVILTACSPDDDGPKGERGPVTVTVLRNEFPVPDAAVVFHTADGTLLGTSRTDATGTVTGEITTWSMVTVIDPIFPNDLVTITRVALGATLELPLDSQGPGEPVGTLTISASASTPPPSAERYSIYTPCTSNVGVSVLPATIDVYARCGAEFPVIIVARAASQNLEDPGMPLAYVAGRATSGAFQPGTWSNTCAQVGVSTELTMSIELWPRLHGFVFRDADLGFCPTTTTSEPTLDFSEGAVADAYANLDAPLRTTSVLRDYAQVPAVLQIPRRDLLVGDVALISLDETGAQWSSEMAPSEADAIDAKLTWPPANSSYLNWRVVLPRDATTAVLPAIPDELRVWDVLDTSDAAVSLRYVDASWLDTLDEIERELPLVLEGRRPLPADGTLRDYIERLSLP